MSGAVSTISGITKWITPVIKTGSNIYSFFEQKHAYEKNYAQYELTKQQLRDSIYNQIYSLNEQYKENLNALSEQLRQVEGTTQAYYGSRGVELFGSAMQSVMDALNKMNKAKINLYKNYVNTYQAVEKGGANSLLNISMIQSQMNERYRNMRTSFLINTSTSLLTDLAKNYFNKPQKVKVY